MRVTRSSLATALLALVAALGAAASVAEEETALAIEADDATTHYNLGVALQEQGKLAEAIIAYREAIRLVPNFAVAHNGLGNALIDQGKVAEAITAYREALR